MSAMRQLIAETFERHVLDHGYARTNLDDIARELKISKKTIYVHFDGKRDIYAHVVALQARRDKVRLGASVAALPTYAAKVDAVVRLILDSARAHITATGEDEWLREYEIAADAFRKANGDLLRELIQGGMDAGEFGAGDASLIERMVAAMIIEYLLLVNADPSYDRDAELAQRIGRFVN
ncbi:MAG: helix-turn-helix domain-containing protein [Coriobacteriia bacterium]|nr:helix-turn-helix domain-containing protein [Coriobacteriia bacterium]